VAVRFTGGGNWKYPLKTTASHIKYMCPHTGSRSDNCGISGDGKCLGTI